MYAFRTDAFFLQRKTTRALLAVILVFSTTWTVPSILLTVHYVITFHEQTVADVRMALYVGALPISVLVHEHFPTGGSAHFNSTLNFFIYALRHPTFNAHLRLLLGNKHALDTLSGSTIGINSNRRSPPTIKETSVEPRDRSTTFPASARLVAKRRVAEYRHSESLSQQPISVSFHREKSDVRTSPSEGNECVEDYQLLLASDCGHNGDVLESDMLPTQAVDQQV